MKCEEIETALSGYLDGELTQQQSQCVEIHLADCAGCCAVLEELRVAREATRGLDIPQPADREWRLMETTILEKSGRSLGWAILLVWVVVTTAYGLFQLAFASGEPLFLKILVFALFLAFGLLFLSVLSERLRTRRSDKYRGVLK